MRGLAAEVSKNIVLAGVRSVAVLDHRPLGPEDAGCRFLAFRPGDNVSSPQVTALVAGACMILLYSSLQCKKETIDHFCVYTVYNTLTYTHLHVHVHVRTHAHTYTVLPRCYAPPPLLRPTFRKKRGGGVTTRTCAFASQLSPPPPPPFYCALLYSARERLSITFVYTLCITHLHVYVHTLTCTYTRARMHTYTLIYTHARMHTYTLTYMYTHARIHTYIYTRTHARTHTNTHTHARTHARMHARTHARTHTHTHTHAHTHTQRAEQAVSHLQSLNPNVSFSADVGNVEDKDDDYFKGYTAVCATCCSTDTMVTPWAPLPRSTPSLGNVRVMWKHGFSLNHARWPCQNV